MARRAKEAQAFMLLRAVGRVAAIGRMAQAGEPGDLPSGAFLRLQDRAGSEGITAVERQAVVEDVEDARHDPGNAAKGLTGRQPKAPSAHGIEERARHRQ